MQFTENFFTNQIVDQFLVKRDLTGDELAYQKIKEDGKLVKTSIRLKERAQSMFDKKNGTEEAKKLADQIEELKARQRDCDLQLLANRNPDPSRLHEWVDLHGATCQQGPRLLAAHIQTVQESLIAGDIKPNCTRREHVLQVITGPGKLSDRINDFVALLGLEFHGNRGNGVFLVKLTNKQADLDSCVMRLAEHEAMKLEQHQKLEEVKEEVRAQKRDFSNQLKADKTQLREDDKAAKQQAKAAEKALKLADLQEKKAQKATEKEEHKAQRKAEMDEKRTQKSAEKAEFQLRKRTIKNAMRDQGFQNFQIKTAGKALDYSTLEEVLAYCAQNNIVPTPKIKKADRVNM